MQYEDPTGELMMLPSDLVLIQDAAFRKHVEAYAKNDAEFQKDFAAVLVAHSLSDLPTNSIKRPEFQNFRHSEI